MVVASGRTSMSELRFGILSTANIADTKVIPGMRKAARVRVAAIGIPRCCSRA